MMMEQDRHLQVVGLMAHLWSEAEPSFLAEFCGERDSEKLRNIFENLSQDSANRDLMDVRRRLNVLQSLKSFSSLDQIHPAWLVENLRKESPRVIGVILRHLPSKHVRYILEHLPSHLVARLPQLVEAFYLPTDILNEVRRRFESHFMPMPISNEILSFSFEHLCFLKLGELEILFHQLGLSELVLSFIGSPRRIVTVVLNRFSLKEAKEMVGLLKTYQTEPAWFCQDARYSILELSGKQVGTQHFLKELGILSLAKAFDAPQSLMFEVLKQKMEPKDAFLLKRYLEENAAGGQLQRVAKRQDWVARHAELLQALKAQNNLKESA